MCWVSAASGPFLENISTPLKVLNMVFLSMGSKWIKMWVLTHFHPLLHPKTHIWPTFDPVSSHWQKPILSGNKLFSKKGPEAALTQHKINGRKIVENLPMPEVSNDGRSVRTGNNAQLWDQATTSNWLRPRRQNCTRCLYKRGPAPLRTNLRKLPGSPLAMHQSAWREQPGCPPVVSAVLSDRRPCQFLWRRTVEIPKVGAILTGINGS